MALSLSFGSPVLRGIDAFQPKLTEVDVITPRTARKHVAAYAGSTIEDHGPPHGSHFAGILADNPVEASDHFLYLSGEPSDLNVANESPIFSMPVQGRLHFLQ